MKCPLFVAASYFGDTHLGGGMGKCLNEECAWWDEDFKVCALRTIPLLLNDIKGGIESLVLKRI